MSKVLMDYIPSPLSEHFDKSIFNLEKWNSGGNLGQTLQNFLDNSNGQVKQYGNWGDLSENLNIYMNFPKNYKRFGDPKQNPVVSASYGEKPFQFTSLKGNVFIRKRDFLIHLRALIVSDYMKAVRFLFFVSRKGTFRNRKIRFIGFNMFRYFNRLQNFIHLLKNTSYYLKIVVNSFDMIRK